MREGRFVPLLDCHKNRFNQCCCTCESQIEDHSHPHIDGKSVLNVRGWICLSPGEDSGSKFYAHSQWPEHSMGCECYKFSERKLKKCASQKQLKKERTSTG